MDFERKANSSYYSEAAANQTLFAMQYRFTRKLRCSITVQSSSIILKHDEPIEQLYKFNICFLLISERS